jgi:hypothetical protein
LRSNEKKINRSNKLEKSIAYDADYSTISTCLDQNKDLKHKYLRTIALKHSFATPIKKGNLSLSEYEHFSSNMKSSKPRGWSESQSHNRSSHYANSVRNSRYKAMGLTEAAK